MQSEFNTKEIKLANILSKISCSQKVKMLILISLQKSNTYLDSLARIVLALSSFRFWRVSIFDDGSLPEITLSDASKLASTLYSYVLNRCSYVID